MDATFMDGILIKGGSTCRACEAVRQRHIDAVDVAVPEILSVGFSGLELITEKVAIPTSIPSTVMCRGTKYCFISVTNVLKRHQIGKLFDCDGTARNACAVVNAQYTRAAPFPGWNDGDTKKSFLQDGIFDQEKYLV